MIKRMSNKKNWIAKEIEIVKYSGFYLMLCDDNIEPKTPHFGSKPQINYSVKYRIKCILQIQLQKHGIMTHTKTP